MSRMELPQPPSSKGGSAVPWYYRVLDAINTASPFLAPTQQTNLALLVSAILKKRTLCLSELARAYPTPKERRVASPKHDLLHRIKRLWRFTDNERVDALGVQLAFSGPTPSPAWASPAYWGWPSTGPSSRPPCPPAGGCAIRFLGSPCPGRAEHCRFCNWPMRPGRPKPQREPEPDRTRGPFGRRGGVADER